MSAAASQTKSTTFTPGPWTADIDEQAPGRGACYVEGPNGWTYQPIAVCDYGNDTDENEANACLIAAAPDLYAALKHIERCAAISDDWLAPVRAALAKAEGRS